MPDVAGIYEGRRLVRSKFESQEVGETFLLQFHPDSSNRMTFAYLNEVNSAPLPTPHGSGCQSRRQDYLRAGPTGHLALHGPGKGEGL